jgi:hypothetical protein
LRVTLLNAVNHSLALNAAAPLLVIGVPFTVRNACGVRKAGA